jgi:hypothetical protein
MTEPTEGADIVAATQSGSDSTPQGGGSAVASSLLCRICDTAMSSVSERVEYCRDCATAGTDALFGRADGSLRALRADLNVNEEQMQSMINVALRSGQVTEASGVYERNGTMDKLLSLTTEAALHKAVAKLRDCSLSRTCRLLISIKNSRIVLAGSLEDTLNECERAEANKYNVVVVSDDAPIPDVPVPPSKYTVRITLQNAPTQGAPAGKKLKMYGSQGDENLDSAAYLYKLVALLQFEIERAESQHSEHIPEPNSYMKQARHSALAKRRKLFENMLISYKLKTPVPKGTSGTATAGTAAVGAGATAGGSGAAATGTAAETGVAVAAGAGATAIGTSAAVAAGAEATAAGTGVAASVTAASASNRIPRPAKLSVSETLRVPLEDLTVCPTQTEPSPTAERFYKDDDWLKNLLATATAQPPPRSSSERLILPHAFTALSFSDAEDIGELVVNRRGWPLPQHITCIIGLPEVYGPLFYHIAVRDAIFAELQTLTVLVPASVSDVIGQVSCLRLNSCDALTLRSPLSLSLS